MSQGSPSQDYCQTYLPSAIVEKLEAGAFRQLCHHLQERSDTVANMDLMTLSGFCRNCLAKVCSVLCVCIHIYYIVLLYTCFDISSLLCPIAAVDGSGSPETGRSE